MTSGCSGCDAAWRLGQDDGTRPRERQEVGEAWYDARMEGVRSRLGELETEAWRRAVDGTEKPVFYKGDECGRITELSNTLPMFLIEAQARRASDDSFAERSDVTSKGDKVEAGLIVVGKPAADADEC